MRSFKSSRLILILLTLLAAFGCAAGCSTVRTVLAVDAEPADTQPIHNPFEGYQAEAHGEKDPYIVRTRKGDRSVEVQIPSNYAQVSDFVVPVNPAFRDTESGERGLASDRAPTMIDREITSSFPPASSPEEAAQRTAIEQDLGVMQSEDYTPTAEKSYLTSMSRVKTLFRDARYEAALLEVDSMLRDYPTDPKLYEMRGTLLDRSGRGDLALRSWEQAIRLNPGNESLRRFVERKRQKRGLASP